MRQGCWVAMVVAVSWLASGCSETKPDCLGAAVVCGGSCVELKSDNLNCGACGTTCVAGQVCSAGHCAQSCAPALAACPTANPTSCVDTVRDANNCGGCGVACAAGQQCSGSGCACPTGRPNACGTGASAMCTDFERDPLNCGGCGTTCGAGTACVAGSCVTSCPTGEYACGGTCVDPKTDSNYCGATSACTGGAACGPSAGCYQGRCEPLCAVGQVMCNGTCINPLTDASFCGASGYCTLASAGVACSTTQSCVAGTCTPPPCTWTQTAAYPLTSAPAGSIPRNGAIGGQGVAVVYGRTAWYQTSDWNILLVPSGFAASDDVFAVEADYYVPPLTTFDREVLIQAFATSTTVGPYQSTLGVLGLMSARVAGSPTFEWWTQAANGVQTKVASQVVSPFVGAWHHLRLEGLRSSCHLRAYFDGAFLSTWTGACDMSGTYFILQGDAVNGGNQAQTAWSNLAIYKGSATACVP
jgi:hypothetical protein